MRERNEKCLISPSVNIQKSIRIMRPSVIISKDEEKEAQKPKKVPPKVKQKGKTNKQGILEEEEEEPSKDRTLEALNDPSISEISVNSELDEDYLSDKLRRRTFVLMDKVNRVF